MSEMGKAAAWGGVEEGMGRKSIAAHFRTEDEPGVAAAVIGGMKEVEMCGFRMQSLVHRCSTYLSLLSLCSAVDLIRSGGKKLRFLVAKSDMEIAKKIISSSASS